MTIALRFRMNGGILRDRGCLTKKNTIQVTLRQPRDLDAPPESLCDRIDNLLIPDGTGVTKHYLASTDEVIDSISGFATGIRL